MRNSKYMFGLICLSVILFACEDSFERTPGGGIVSTNPTLNALPENEFTIEAPQDDADGQFLFRTSWSRPRISYENGLPVEVENMRYALQAGILSQNFAQEVVVAETDGLFADIFSGKLYNAIEELIDGDFDETQNIELRVVADYDGNTEELVSNSVIIVVSKAASWEPVELTIRFKQAAGDWEEFAVYAWGAEEAYGGWPGKKLEANADGWYSFTVPISRPINLIINNNGNGEQFDFISDPTEDACYEFNTDDNSFTVVDCD